jgi:Carboxypeptidase regulatory-like domain/TonB-dependent Receptor Plug Domain
MTAIQRIGLPRPIAALATAVALLVAMTATPAGAQERFSGLTGTVTDASGAVLPGATVAITNKETGKVFTAVTGADGVYRVLDLEPGRYSVKVELSGFATTEFPDVNLFLGKTITVDSSLKIGGVAEAISVTAESPLIDTRNTTIAHNVSAEEFERIPKGRTFQNIAMASPSVNTGEVEGGIQVNGASGSENSFTVDGVVTNSLIHGGSRQDAVFEYLQEVQVKTGGISAEYGGALGGVISAVTKSGGNSYRGEAHYYFTGAGTSAAPVERLVLNPADDITVNYFQDVKQPNNRHDIGGSLGGPILRDKLFFFGSWAPRYVRRNNDYIFAGGETGNIEQKQTINSAFGKVNYDPSNRLRTSFSVLWTPTTSEGTLPAYNDFAPNTISSSKASNENQKTRGFEIPQVSYTGTLDFTLSNSSLLSVRGGMFDDNYRDTGVPLISSVSYQTSNITGAALSYPVPADLRGGVGFQNTSRVQLSLEDRTKRAFGQVDYIQAFNAGGNHNLKAGFGIQHTSNTVDNTYPGGGYVFIWWDNAFTSSATGLTDRGPYGYYEVNDFGTRGEASADILSLYVQDQWQMNNLTLSLGLRTEREVIPSFRKDIKAEGFKFNFGDKLAPRIGASYDVRGDGRFKVYGNWGRYFDWTKYELSRGGFGGDIWRVQYRSLDTTDVFSLSGTNLPGRNLWTPEAGSFRDRRVPNFDTVDPNIKPMSQDAMNAGFEYQLQGNQTVSVNYSHSTLRRTIEDLGVLENGDEVYKYVNPGEGIAATMVPSGLTTEFATPKPKRQYDALEVSWQKRFSNNWFGSASYVYSRLYGNYAGLSNSDEISTPTTGRSSATAQQQAGSIARPGSSAHRAWDLDELVWDSHGNLDVLGRLATDRPHAVKLYGSYMLPTQTQIGAFFYGASGTPVSTTVSSLNGIPLFVEGRGSWGRTPVLTQTDLLVSHDLKFGGSKRLRLEANVINVFNQKTARHIFDSLNRPRRASSAVNLANTDLAAGYDYNALLAARPDGANSKDPRYGMEDLFNPGLQARFSVRFLF